MTKVDATQPPPAPQQNFAMEATAQRAQAVAVKKAESHETGATPKVGVAEMRDKLQELADQAFAGAAVELSISYDDSSGLFIYRGLDPESGEVVREYPPEEVLRRMRHLRDLRGLSLDRSL